MWIETLILVPIGKLCYWTMIINLKRPALMDKRIYKILVAFKDAYIGKIMKCDVVSYKGKLWLVPDWIKNLQVGKMQPVRIILFDELRYQRTSLGGADFILSDPLPIRLFQGKEKVFGYTVIESPDLWVEVPPDTRQ